MEFLLSKGELSFPWLTLANTQTYNIADIQISSIVGAYGISFWLLCLNVMAFILYDRLSTSTWKFRSVSALTHIGLFVVLLIVPKIYGLNVLSATEQSGGSSPVRIGIIQPNIDPFEKWQQHAGEQLELLERLTVAASPQHIDLALWPETAAPMFILDPANRLYFETMKQTIDSLHISLLTGIPDITYYNAGDRIPQSSKRSADGRRYDTYNSSMLLQPGSEPIEKYAKTILVPFAERVPYSEELSFLNAMKWNFGLGGWGRGTDTTVFSFHTSKGKTVQFSNLICYESVFPGYVAKFVRKGAGFLTIITNDSWWGNTSGAYQHGQFAVLRAVENRRWVARCANGGISCFIDPFGHVLLPTSMYAQATIVADVVPRTDLTFYSLHGDWLAEACLVLTGLFVAAAFGKLAYDKIRRSTP
jgi:apolipoprotein N-acyltransferase